ncbi:MAG: acetolactate synthase large subunit [Desulfovibrio sp.]|nr:MAG: acetolactate synthase large subunit [Desulfovibrio sp.]
MESGKGEKQSGASILVKLLERQGISMVAGIPGGANLPLYDALATSGIRHVLTRHEQGAGFIAQGMARVTGTPQVFLATSGPGATNTLTAIADAKLDSVPIICITGQVPSPMIGTDAFQEVDIYGMSLPVTKHNFLVRTTEELLEVVPEAFRIAASGRPGPVLIDVPKDVQAAQICVNQWPEPGQADPYPALDLEAIEQAAQMINEAERPVLYIGGGVSQSGAASAAMCLAMRSSIPVAQTLMGLGAIPRDHILDLGMLGMHGARFTNYILEECDLLISLGVRFDDRATGKVEQFCPDASIIHVDIDPGELDKIKTAHVGVTADAGEFLAALMPMVEAKARAGWLSRVAELKAEHPFRTPGARDPRSPYGLILEAAKRMGEKVNVATDVGQHQMRTAQVYPLTKPGQLLTSGGLGTMGFGLPAAIGAALADPDTPVLCVSGDGSLLMNIQELATAVEQRANVKILLMNNGGLGLVRQQQELFYDNNLFASEYTHCVDYVTIAKGFGMNAIDLAHASDPGAALEAAFATPGPCLIHAPIMEPENVYPMVPPGAANSDMIGGEHAHSEPCTA